MALERYFQSARPERGNVSPPSRTIARQVNKLFIHVQRAAYVRRGTAITLSILQRGTEPCTSKKGKACHSWRRAVEKPPISGCLNVKMRGARHNAWTPRYVSYRQITRASPTISQYL